MGVDAARDDALRVAGEAEGGIRQGEGQAAVTDAVEVEMALLDRHARHGAAERGLDELDAETRAEFVTAGQRRDVDRGRFGLVAHSAACLSGDVAPAMAASVRDSDSPSGSASAATRALATASAAARGVRRPARAGAITSSAMRR